MIKALTSLDKLEPVQFSPGAHKACYVNLSKALEGEGSGPAKSEEAVKELATIDPKSR